MSHRALLAILIAFAAVCPAYAADLTVGLGAEAEYDRNVFRRERDRKDDFLFRLRPSVRLHEDRGNDLNYSLRYELPVEFAAEFNEEIQDVDHAVDGNATYRVDERLEFFVRDNLRLLRSTVRTEEITTAPDTVGIPQISNERDRVTMNNASLGARYLFAPRLQGRVVASSRLFDTSRSDRADNYAVSGLVAADYVVTAKHQIGGGFRYAFQDFDNRTGISGSQAHVYNGFATWRWLIDPTMDLEISAGPSFLQSEQDDSPAARMESRVPFQLLPAGNYNFFDKNGNLNVNQPVAAGSLFVPSFFVNAGGGPAQNCNTVDGMAVASGCTVNVILDAINDAADVANLTGNPIAVTNINPRGRKNENLTIFASAVLVKHWTPNLHTALRYEREQGNASGLGGTVIVDAVSIANTWDFLERWQLAVRGDWTNRESAFDLRQTHDSVTPVAISAIPGGSGSGTVMVASRTGGAFNSTQNAEIDTQRWSVAGRITHRLFKSTLIYGQLRYDEQTSDAGSLGRGSDFENYLATVGIRHTFEPIKLW